MEEKRISIKLNSFQQAWFREQLTKHLQESVDAVAAAESLIEYFAELELQENGVTNSQILEWLNSNGFIVEDTYEALIECLKPFEELRLIHLRRRASNGFPNFYGVNMRAVEVTFNTNLSLA